MTGASNKLKIVSLHLSASANMAAYLHALIEDGVKSVPAIIVFIICF
jgi:hypothetical protein